LKGKYCRTFFGRGAEIARVGDAQVNGNWPPHLHFELITDMMGLKGDFPGVCSLEERDKFLDICLDPNLILKISNI